MPKFVIKAPRYYEGRYIDASPEYPVVIEVHEKYKPHVDQGLNPYRGGEVEGEQLKQHFVPPGGEEVRTSVQVFSEPKGKGKRPSDVDV